MSTLSPHTSSPSDDSAHNNTTPAASLDREDTVLERERERGGEKNLHLPSLYCKYRVYDLVRRKNCKAGVPEKRSRERGVGETWVTERDTGVPTFWLQRFSTNLSTGVR